MNVVATATGNPLSHPQTRNAFPSTPLKGVEGKALSEVNYPISEQEACCCKASCSTSLVCDLFYKMDQRLHIVERSCRYRTAIARHVR
jgi:hypothetical protein